MPNWKIKEKAEIQSPHPDIHPVALQLLYQRKLDTKEKIEKFLNPDYDRDVLDPFLFSRMEEAVARIKKAAEKKEKVLVYGDYDADGVTSTVLLKEALEEIGIFPEVYIPHKKIEGYGLNQEAVENFAKDKIQLVLTVDCGISNAKEIGLAGEKGIEIIIVDHHHAPTVLPPALAIVNPQVKDEKYPFKSLAGVGVVFKLVQAIYEKFLPEKKEQAKWLLDLAAIGTIADCVPLTGENRILAKYGLLVLSKTRRVGLQELFAVGRIQIDENNLPDARKVAFQVAPRLNAAGRMDHAGTAFNLIIEEDRVRARDLALEIEDSNQRRQKETDRVVEEVRILASTLYKNKKFIFAAGEHFPIGIAGLVAGKLADEFNKPVAIFQKEEKISRGSFRSVPQLNIIETIEKCASLLEKFGGHSQAAGVAVKNENLEKFYEAMDKLIEKELEGKDCAPQIEIDAELEAKDIDFELAEIIEKFAPFGEENEEPVFLLKNLIISKIKNVGNDNQHLKLFLRPSNGSPKIFETIGFNLNEKFSHLTAENRVDIVFNLQIDDWNGSKKLQMKLVDLKISQ